MPDMNQQMQQNQQPSMQGQLPDPVGQVAVPGVNYGLLQPLSQASPIRTAAPQAQQAPAPSPGGGEGGGSSSASKGKGGGLLSGIGSALSGALSDVKSLFGDNPVSTANQAVQSSMQNMPQGQLAQQITGMRDPNAQTNFGPSNALKAQMNNPQNPNVSQSNPMSIGNLQQQAQKMYPNNPVMQQMMVAQATQESGLLGQPSGLASGFNNLFGMKGNGTAGSVNMQTNEFNDNSMSKTQAGFAAYNNINDSLNAYQKLLNTPRYANVSKSSTFEEAANNLYKDGYATDPQYAQELIKLNNTIQKNDYSTGSKVSTVAMGQAASNNPQDLFKMAQSYLGDAASNINSTTIGKTFEKLSGGELAPQGVPWCANFVNGVLEANGLKGSGSSLAKSFLHYGTPTNIPTQGDIVVMGNTNSVHGHVGFFAGWGENGEIKVLGGNQRIDPSNPEKGHNVNIQSYPMTRVLGFRIPPSMPSQIKHSIPRTPNENIIKSPMTNVLRNMSPSQNPAQSIQGPPVQTDGLLD